MLRSPQLLSTPLIEEAYDIYKSIFSCITTLEEYLHICTGNY